LPHLRFTRDKRGYENTYVLHSVRRRGKARQRVLYWFRTPPNIRVGRAALDEEAIRAIEECNPDIAFDWSKILEAQPAPASAEPSERRRRPRKGQVQQAVLPAPAVLPSKPERATGAERIEEAATAREIAEAVPPPVEPLPAADVVAAEAAESAEIEPPALVPVTVYHGGADVLVAEGADHPRLSAVEARLGSEQLSRVRARYAEMLARITQRVGGDPVRLEEMRRAAELLNPDAWVTEEEIAGGLQHFDARLGEIRRVLGIKRRRRSRRGGRRRRRGVMPGPSSPAVETPGPGGRASADQTEELDRESTGESSNGEDPED
jgi:hypothetical protein